MTSPAALVTTLLEPELAVLAALAPDAAAKRRRLMATDALTFARGSLGLHVWWLATHTAADTPWVWAIGDAHQGNFATLATGPLDRDGRSRVTYGIADIDDEHPAPWTWDALRLLASLATARPRLTRRVFTTLASACLAEYVRVLTAAADDDDAICRLDYTGLPEALKQLIDQDAGDKHRQSHCADLISGRGAAARLRLGKQAEADRQARDIFLPALEQTLAQQKKLPKHAVLDVARRTTGGGLSSLGRQRWWALLRERDRHGDWQPRVLEIKERRPSILARVVPLTSFAPVTGLQTWTLPMGNDPWQCVLHGPAGDYLVRTRCQARSVIDLAALDDGDLLRLVRLWGQLIANAHATSLRALGINLAVRAAAIITDAASQKNALSAQAWDLARFNAQAFAAFRAKRGRV